MPSSEWQVVSCDAHRNLLSCQDPLLSNHVAPHPPAVQQHALVAVNVSDRRLARRGGTKARVKRAHASAAKRLGIRARSERRGRWRGRRRRYGGSSQAACLQGTLGHAHEGCSLRMSMNLSPLESSSTCGHHEKKFNRVSDEPAAKSAARRQAARAEQLPAASSRPRCKVRNRLKIAFIAVRTAQKRPKGQRDCSEEPRGHPSGRPNPSPAPGADTLGHCWVSMDASPGPAFDMTEFPALPSLLCAALAALRRTGNSTLVPSGIVSTAMPSWRGLAGVTVSPSMSDLPGIAEASGVGIKQLKLVQRSRGGGQSVEAAEVARQRCRQRSHRAAAPAVAQRTLHVLIN